MHVFFFVFARDGSEVARKAQELDSLAYPYLIVCGENVNYPNVVYRKPNGKYDAINFASGLVPENVEIVGLNDADTTIRNLKAALDLFKERSVSLVFVRVNVRSGPQLLFYSILDALRRRLPIVASGELMLIRREVFKKVCPVEMCKAEDSYILFKALEYGHRVAFCEESYVITKRTSNANEEENYKRRTVGGIYQALSMTKPPGLVKFFYIVLPFISPLLLILGGKGYYWSKGILRGFVDYLRGDQAGSWRPIHAQDKQRFEK